MYLGGYAQLSAGLLPRKGLAVTNKKNAGIGVPNDRVSRLSGKKNIQEKALKWPLTIDWSLTGVPSSRFTARRMTKG